ncbi:MAG: thiol:disulfide interchange protein DsbA/DsbL [Pseudomonadota bacterium]
MLRTRTLSSLLIALSALVLALPAAAETAFQEGEHYERLPVPVDTRDPDDVEVVEVFSYACVHCRDFQPYIDRWREDKPEYVDFYRMPATFNEAWAALAQGYYTAESMGATEQVHDAMFTAIHDDGVNLADPERMAQVFEDAAGVSPEVFQQVFSSFSVRSRVQQADARGRAYRINGTPSMIVDGMYRVDGRMAGSNSAMLDVVDFLVAQRRAARSEGGAQ